MHQLDHCYAYNFRTANGTTLCEGKGDRLSEEGTNEQLKVYSVKREAHCEFWQFAM